jgi:tRNA threonylcarbamoyladenosine biosynthesis protein TsaB
MILCLETATNNCSVALCDANGVLALRESNDLRSHATELTVFILEVLREVSVKTQDLGAVAVSKGPGSYTGLRIGVSVAKGIAFASSVPLIGIDTTLSMFHGLKNQISSAEDVLFCPVLDAKRMEVYYAIYDSHGNVVKEISAETISEDSFGLYQDKTIIIFGNGSAKLEPVIRQKNVRFEDNFRMSASNLLSPALQSLQLKKFEDVAYFEPFYLKDFIATKPKKNILGV